MMSLYVEDNITVEPANSVIKATVASVGANRLAIESVNIKGYLSFGLNGIGIDGDGIKLRPVNLIIGPNGSGKSNFINAFNLLRLSSQGPMLRYLLKTGGTRGSLWRGVSSRAAKATIETVLGAGEIVDVPLRYQLSFGSNERGQLVLDETLSDGPSEGNIKPREYLAYKNGGPALSTYDEQSKTYKMRKLRRDFINPQESVLSQREDPERYPQIASASRLLRSSRFYLDWDFGRSSTVRGAQLIAERAELQVDSFLRADASNLIAYLKNLYDNDSTFRDRFLTCLKDFYPDVEDVEITQVGRPVEYLQLRFKEKYLASTTPASQLSEGTLRWLALLAVLLDPAPPRLICLEEPEVNLHPAIMPLLANLLRDASKRTQLIVSTHSETLIDQFSDEPENVFVCEKREGATRMRQLSSDLLSSWLEMYRLGELWKMDIFGGNT